MVIIEETLLYRYGLETKQQSMEWRYRGSPCPQKNSECRIPLEKFSPRLFGIKTPSSLIILQRAKLSTQSITHLCGCNLRTFWGKNAAGNSPRDGFFLHDNASVHRALTTQKNLAYLGFQCLDHSLHSPDLSLSDYHLFPGRKKTIESSPFFVRRGGHCCRGDLVGRTIFWIFLSGLQK